MPIALAAGMALIIFLYIPSEWSLRKDRKVTVCSQYANVFRLLYLFLKNCLRLCVFFFSISPVRLLQSICFRKSPPQPTQASLMWTTGMTTLDETFSFLIVTSDKRNCQASHNFCYCMFRIDNVIYPYHYCYTCLHKIPTRKR